MDHADARELLETAATEPGGLDRLMAGDTADSSALAGHLAGCEDCAEEVGRIRRDAAVIRTVVRSLPPADLRERTLAYVAAVGRDRSAPVATGVRGTAPAERPPSAGASTPRERRRISPGWLAAVAAVLIAAVAGSALLAGAQGNARIAALEAELARRGDAVAALQRVSTAGIRVASEPDAELVELAAAGGRDASGSLVFSPATGELVVIASGLAEPEPGRELRCWVEVDGRRRSVGRMFFADELSFWVGPVDDLGGLPPGTRFGVTLVDVGDSSLDGDPVLSGVL